MTKRTRSAGIRVGVHSTPVLLAAAAVAPRRRQQLPLRQEEEGAATRRAAYLGDGRASTSSHHPHRHSAESGAGSDGHTHKSQRGSLQSVRIVDPSVANLADGARGVLRPGAATGRTRLAATIRLPSTVAVAKAPMSPIACLFW